MASTSDPTPPTEPKTYQTAGRQVTENRAPIQQQFNIQGPVVFSTAPVTSELLVWAIIGASCVLAIGLTLGVSTLLAGVGLLALAIGVALVAPSLRAAMSPGGARAWPAAIGLTTVILGPTVMIGDHLSRWRTLQDTGSTQTATAGSSSLRAARAAGSQKGTTKLSSREKELARGGLLPDVPTASPESCDGLDNDGDGLVDEEGSVGATRYFFDADDDGFGDPGAPSLLCAREERFVTMAADCDDKDGSVNPAAVERCDGLDNDCDGKVDEGSACR